MVSSYSDDGIVAETTRGTETSARAEDVRSVSLWLRLLHKSRWKGNPAEQGDTCLAEEKDQSETGNASSSNCGLDSTPL